MVFTVNQDDTEYYFSKFGPFGLQVTASDGSAKENFITRDFVGPGRIAKPELRQDFQTCIIDAYSNPETLSPKCKSLLNVEYKNLDDKFLMSALGVTDPLRVDSDARFDTIFGITGPSEQNVCNVNQFLGKFNCNALNGPSKDERTDLICTILNKYSDENGVPYVEYDSQYDPTSASNVSETSLSDSLLQQCKGRDVKLKRVSASGEIITSDVMNKDSMFFFWTEPERSDLQQS